MRYDLRKELLTAILRWLLMMILIAMVIAVLGLILLGAQSRMGVSPPLVGGKLLPCAGSPNCVCSEYSEAQNHYIKPVNIAVQQSFEVFLQEWVRVIESMGGRVVEQSDRHISAYFTSAVFGFVDDFQLRLDESRGLMHIRSSSRVGYSDLGANRKRVKIFKQRLEG